MILDTNERRLEAAHATGDPDLIEQTQADLDESLAAYQDALAAAERACFVAGTLILTPTGLRAIESLKVGKTVLAGNPHTGQVKECRILQTFVREVSQIFEVQVGEESIECSAEHPFWVVDQGWTHANRLRVGDQCMTSAGEVVAIDQVRSRLEKVTVYNFEVEDLHTYFVSDLGILVHNTNCSNHQFPTEPAQVRHIFGNRPGHLPDTPENRTLLQEVANEPTNRLGEPDRYGNTWYGRIESDGRQVWVRTRNNIITNAGINDVPRSYDPDTGLNNPLP